MFNEYWSTRGVGAVRLNPALPSRNFNARVRLPAIVGGIGSGSRVGVRRRDGTLLCLSDLPRPDQRWTRRRKQIVAECVGAGLISTEAACQRYGLSRAELGEWRAIAAAGESSPPALWHDRPRRFSAGTVSAGGAEIDLDRHDVRLNGWSVDLTPAEWRIAAALAEAGGQIVSNAMLMATTSPNRQKVPSAKTIDVLIYRLRHKLAAEGRWIAAIWGRGYRLEGARVMAAGNA